MVKSMKECPSAPLKPWKTKVWLPAQCPASQKKTPKAIGSLLDFSWNVTASLSEVSTI
jgi:hypothetical protein